MLDSYDVVTADQLTKARAALLIEAIDQVRTRAQRYLQEPAEGPWRDLVAALARVHGDGATYELLRAVEIHSRTALPR
jgi:hypothetical protein